MQLITHSDLRIEINIAYKSLLMLIRKNPGNAIFPKPVNSDRGASYFYYDREECLAWYAKCGHKPQKAHGRKVKVDEQGNVRLCGFDNKLARAFLIPKKVKKQHWGDLANKFSSKKTKTVQCKVLDEYTPNAKLHNQAPQHYFEAY